MLFRSVRFYSLTSPWPDSEQDLSEKLFGAAFKPCGPYMELSSGFEPPVGEQHGLLARRVAGADLLRMRSQGRVLPAAAIKEALEVRIDEYRARMQEEPGRRVKRQLKEQTRDELLPKALVKSDRTSALYLGNERVLAVGTASESKAERFLEQLRAALGKLEAKPLAFHTPFAALLHWTFRGDGPRELIVGRECRMRDPSENKGLVRWQNFDLGQDPVRDSLDEGLELTHLGFEFGNLLSGVLDVNGVLTKLELLGVEEPAEGSAEDQLARQDAEIALLAGTLRQLLATWRQALGFETRDTAEGSAEERLAPAPAGYAEAAVGTL
jgi:recombination associated protein RdgC